MKAATLVEPRRIEVRDVPLPEPGPSDVLVKLEGCGVCASNLPPWQGRDWFSYPHEPGQLGHEGWGRIARLGREVEHDAVGQPLAEGDRVAMLSNHAYAEFDVANAMSLVKLPNADPGAETGSAAETSGLGDGTPFPGEPLGCAVNIFERSHVEAGQTVAILGIGFLGALLVQMCKEAGATVIAISRREYSLEVAQQAGADHLIEWGDDMWAVVARVAELTAGVGGYGEVSGWCDRVIECTGKQPALDLLGQIAAVRARCVLAGFHQDGPRTIDLQLWNWRGLDIINAHERDPHRYTGGIHAAARRVAGGTLHPNPLYTHRFPLDQLDRALQLTENRPEGFVKALIDL